MLYAIMLYNISKFDLQQSRKLYPYFMITSNTLTPHNRNKFQPPTSHTYNHSTRKSSLIDADFCTEIQLHIKRLFYGYMSKCHGMLDQQRIHQFFMCCLGKVDNRNSKSLRQFLAGISTVNINTFSYSKLIKFISGPYFAQMVIQNLKSDGTYHDIDQQNNKINENQFIITMQQFLGIINFQYNSSQIQKQIRNVFTVIDRDRDELVSLEELQTWMREYIGNNVVDLPINIIETTFTEEYEVSLRRICKLVFPQLKSMLIQFDKSSKMSLTAAQIQIFLSIYFPNSTSISISAHCIPQSVSQSSITYSQCLNIISASLFNPKISLSCLSSQFLLFSPNQMHISKQQFVNRFMFNQLHALRIRPAVYMMEEIYDYLILRQDKYDHHEDVYGGATQGSDLDNSRTINKNLTMLNYVQFLKDVHNCYQKESKL